MDYWVASYYDAGQHGPRRKLSDIRRIVVHSMENTAYDRAAENVGAYFETTSRAASAHYGIDDSGPVQRYLPLTVVAWGARGANFDGVHLELMGRAAWSREEWMQHQGTLDRAAWQIARVSRYLGERGIYLPIRLLSDEQLRHGMRGITTHATINRVLSGGTHWDPGPGFPMDWLIRHARRHKAH